MDLNTTWFFLVAALIGGYAALDGFDLGVGVIHLFSKSEKARLLHLKAIGPVWDGNEVWLLTGGGALFAAFPIVYAQIFSGFYLAFTLLMLTLIMRAVSMEFRAQFDSPGWKKVWDIMFGLGSLTPALLFGVAVGNILKGLPIEADGSLHIPFLHLLNPYALLVGVTGLFMQVMHGATFLAVKTEDDVQENAIKWLNASWVAFVVTYVLATIYTLFIARHLFEGNLGNPLFWIFFITLLISIGYIPVSVKSRKFNLTMTATTLVTLSVIGITGVSLYPVMVPSSLDFANSFTIYNASSTPKTLKTMLVIALTGMPLVMGYTFYVYRIFRGKVRLDSDGYK
jgi:cytochrome d ubiquinol oxidase subunit II